MTQFEYINQYYSLFTQQDLQALMKIYNWIKIYQT